VLQPGETSVYLGEEEAQQLLAFLINQLFFTWVLQVVAFGKQQILVILGKIYLTDFLEDL
jgi:hypothetical protein